MVRDGGNKRLLQGQRERVKQNGLMVGKTGKRDKMMSKGKSEYKEE